MTTPSWHDAGLLQDVVQPWPERHVGAAHVRLVLVGPGHVVAIAPDCPHLQAPLTSAEVNNATIECPRHWYAFDLDSGACVVPVRDDVALAMWPARIVGTNVQVLA